MRDLPEILLFGAGGHCHSCIDVLEQEDRFRIAGVIEQPGTVSGGDVLGYPLLGTDDDMETLRKQFSYAMVTVGQIRTPAVRMKLFETLKMHDFILPTIVSPRAYISKHAKLGEGSVVMHDAIVNAGAEIGINCIINSKALVEHDVCIGDHCHISTGAIVNGAVHIGAKSFIGSNAVVVQDSTISENSFIKASSLSKLNH